MAKMERMMGVRTHDVLIGSQKLCQLSYIRIGNTIQDTVRAKD